MALEKSERYICIGIDEDLKDAQIISFIRSYTNKLDKLCKQYPKSYRHVSDQFDDDELVGKEFICDKRLVSFRAPKNTKEKTEEEKKIIGERLQKGKKARKPREKKPII
ncbi:MAG: hypothetical protein RBQ63_03795 [Acholeplasmatales bacterium]|nr:hypothetical protein [Acholeplasmatales bacterium]